MKKIILTSLILLTGVIVFAQKDSSALKRKLMPRPPIYGIPAKTLPQGKFIYRSYFTYTNYTQMYNSMEDKMTEMPLSMDFKNYNYTPKLRYGITNRFTLIANIPFYYKQLKSTSINKDGIGVGDVIIAGLYRFYFNKQKKFLISGLLFSKYPTGKYRNLSSDELPLGTGSYDGGIALLPEKEFGKWDMRFSAFYIFRSKNKLDIDLGDVQNYSLSVAYNFSKKFIAESSILYKSAFNNKKNGNIIPNTNTYISQAIIGAQYRISSTFLLQAAMPITITAKTPFASKYDIWLGIFYLM